MELISKEAVEKTLSDSIDKHNKELFEITGTSEDTDHFNRINSRLAEDKEISVEVSQLSSAFEGMTYGEVIKAVFGIKDEQIEEAKYLISIYPKGNHHDPFMAVKREVWNSPYKELSVICGTVGASE